MKAQRLFLMVVAVVAVLAVVGALMVSVASGRTPSYAVKTQVLDKSATDKWIEVRILEQTKGKTSLLGDKVIVRVLATTVAYSKVNKKQSTKSWLTKVQNDDLVSVLGEFKSSDGTIWADRVVNRSR